MCQLHLLRTIFLFPLEFDLCPYPSSCVAEISAIVVGLRCIIVRLIIILGVVGAIVITTSIPSSCILAIVATRWIIIYLTCKIGLNYI
jgi:hypothetical protein